MNDFTVKELIELLKLLPQDGWVSQHSGEDGGIILVTSKNGNKQYSVLKTGKVK